MAVRAQSPGVGSPEARRENPGAEGSTPLGFPTEGTGTAFGDSGSSPALCLTPGRTEALRPGLGPPPGQDWMPRGSPGERGSVGGRVPHCWKARAPRAALSLARLTFRSAPAGTCTATPSPPAGPHVGRHVENNKPSRRGGCSVVRGCVLQHL